MWEDLADEAREEWEQAKEELDDAYIQLRDEPEDYRDAILREIPRLRRAALAAGRWYRWASAVRDFMRADDALIEARHPHPFPEGWFEYD